MDVYVKDILRSIKENDWSNIVALSEVECKNMFDVLSKKYADEKLSYYAFWERLIDYVSFRDARGWETIPKIVGDKECIMLLEKDKRFGVRIPSGDLLFKLLEDTFTYVFYVTNNEMDYLMCFNDHEFVLSCGEAPNWLLNYYKQHH